VSPFAIAEMVARQQIYDVLCRYCHGIDRCDVELLKSAYWPDAYEEHGTYDGPSWDFAEHITASMRQGLLRSTQMIGNTLIEFDPAVDKARVETYVVAYLQSEADGEIVDRTVGGRYLDRFERRNGEWRILRRLYVLDWNRNEKSTAIWDEGIFAMLRVRGARHPVDPWDQGLPRHEGCDPRHRAERSE
jgi:hypothetical protein